MIFCSISTKKLLAHRLTFNPGDKLPRLTLTKNSFAYRVYLLEQLTFAYF